MRPHRLRLTAFGAFAEPVEVAFDELDGLFLLHGETGAGKTTLLDAIAFALYGRVPGERGKARRLRSDHAAPRARTEVELELTIGGRRLRVTRSPEWERPKKNGTGTTKAPASVRLDEATDSGGWENKSTRAGEADAEIAHLMGMSAEQFFQVVLLPQGQFAKFLQSEAKDRADLLQRLFGTDRFQAVERWLADRRVATARQVEVAADGVTQLVTRVAQAAGQPKPEPQAGPAAADDAPWQVAWAAGLLASATGRQQQAADTAAACRAELDSALAGLSEAEQLADRQRRRAGARDRQAGLRAEAPAVGQLRRELEAARRAAEVAPVLDEARRAQDAAAAADRAGQEARAGLPADVLARCAAPADAGTAGADDSGQDSAATLREVEQQQRVRFGQLEQLRSVARQASAEDEAAARASTRAAELDSALSQAQAGAARCRAARPEVSSARHEASQAASQLPPAQATARACRQAAADCAALLAARTSHQALVTAHLTARERAVGLREEAQRLREARIDGMRAELAATLVDGAPCPVCGSLDHPELCELTGEAVGREQEQAAYAAADQATAAADSAGQQVAASDADISGLTARLASTSQDLPGGLGGPGTIAGLDLMAVADLATLAAVGGQVDLAAAAAEASAARLATAAAGLDDLQQELEGLDAALAQAERKQAELTEQRAAAISEAEGAARRAAGYRQALRSQLGDQASLDEALLNAQRVADAAAAAAQAIDDAGSARKAAAAAAERAILAAARAGFGGASELTDTTGVDAARAAARDLDWQKSADMRIREHEGAVEAVESVLADPELDVALDPPAPVAARREAVEAARARHEQAVDAHSQARHAATQLADLKPQLAEALAELAPVAARAAEARQLADLAGGLGANQYKMTLSSFVLAARLEEVAAAASQRLLAMTAGRYSLVHTDARKGNTRAGLGLLACDAWTGQDRDTATLSGGETFLASLALALGLADVVTAEAAGTPMEALFVDEGFGTLDEDTLEEVMTVLDGLREGGRLVGIVSHVSELRQRIPTRIHVRKGHHGSHVSVTAG